MSLLVSAPARHPLDRLGIGASLVCAVHCLAAPVVFALAPAVLGWWSDPRVHLAGAVLVVPVAAVALIAGYRHHARWWVLVLGGLGVVGILAGLLPPGWLPSPPTWSTGGPAAGAACDEVCCPTLANSAADGWTLVLPWGGVLTTLGGLALVAAHVGNLAGRYRCAGSATGDCPG